jgi:putative spermidine/putrescine transport system permease protein
MPATKSSRRNRIAELTYRVVLAALTYFSIFLLVAPVIVILIISLTDGYSLKFPPQGLSFRWYLALLDAREFQIAAQNSLIVALVTTTISVAFGVPAALGLNQMKGLGLIALDSFFMSPLILPGLAFGLSALLFFSVLGIPLGIGTLAAGHIVISVPFVIRTTLTSLSQFDPALAEASASLGARPLYTFQRVKWPLIREGVVAGAFLAFMSSFDNVAVSLFLSDARTEMLPIRIWQTLESSLDVRAGAIAGILVVLTSVSMLVMERLVGLSRRI